MFLIRNEAFIPRNESPFSASTRAEFSGENSLCLIRNVVELFQQDTKKIEVAIYTCSNTMDWAYINKTGTFFRPMVVC